MSHSKHTKRDYSIYIEKWDKSAKKYIITCAICGHKGYSPVVEEEGCFVERVIYYENNRVGKQRTNRCISAIF